MQKEIASQIILSHLMRLTVNTNKEDINSVSLNQIKMWIVPQKAEHNDNYNINHGYFELLVNQTLHDLLQNGYIKSSYHDEAEYGEEQMYSLTEEGIKYLEGNVTPYKTNW
jgi:predicted transcriptional regulator YheO